MQLDVIHNTAKHNRFGGIDVFIVHPTYGEIPFTASPEDVEELGRELYQRALDGEFGGIEPYTPPIATEQAIAHNNEMTRLRQLAYQRESDPLFLKSQRGEATHEEWLAAIQAIKDRYPMVEVPE